MPPWSSVLHRICPTTLYSPGIRRIDIECVHRGLYTLHRSTFGSHAVPCSRCHTAVGTIGSMIPMSMDFLTAGHKEENPRAKTKPGPQRPILDSFGKALQCGGLDCLAPEATAMGGSGASTSAFLVCFGPKEVEVRAAEVGGHTRSQESRAILSLETWRWTHRSVGECGRDYGPCACLPGWGLTPCRSVT
jgi:hypothetical protein